MRETGERRRGINSALETAINLRTQNVAMSWPNVGMSWDVSSSSQLSFPIRGRAHNNDMWSVLHESLIGYGFQTVPLSLRIIGTT
jgi:hypothetical protein